MEGVSGTLHLAVQDEQTELDRFQGPSADKAEIKNTKWSEERMMISAAPDRQDLPARTMPVLDAFFEKSEY